MKLTDLSKTISHALRHEPWVYELEIDAQGWVSTEQLLKALRECLNEWKNVDQATIQQIIDTSEKKRFEISGDKIRAIYGHSTPEKLSYEPSEPPSILYHGTTIATAKIILEDGIKAMTRQYVHLSPNVDVAKEVAKRKGKDIVLLSINALDANKHGIKFYAGNEHVWLADYVPKEYIE